MNGTHDALANAGAYYRHIYLSPHSDDVALSCGGLVYEQTQAGEPVLVATFFSATPPMADFSPFAQGQHDKWELLEAAMDHRRQEDAQALEILGADGHYLDQLDCIYRLHPQTGQAMYASEEGIFGAIDPAEAEYHLELAERTVKLVGPPRDELVLYAPLTVGHHIDHQLLRRASLALLERGYTVVYYEDYPYAQEPDRLAAALDDWPLKEPPTPHLMPISAPALLARVRAIAAYGSQINTLFGDLETMQGQVQGYCVGLAAEADHMPAGAACAERYWTP